jgi:VanZ family protein
MKKLLYSNWVGGLYLLLLLVGALIPLGMGSEPLSNNYTFHIRADYLLHALFYIPLPLILLLSRSGRSGGWLKVILVAAVVVVLFEMVQMLVPYRAFNINDLIANGVGVLIGLVLFVILGKGQLRNIA